MKLSYLLLALMVWGCSPKRAPEVKQDAPRVEVESPSETPKDLPGATVPKITITGFINATEAEKERNLKAIERIQDTVQGQCFRDGLINGEKLIDTNGKTREEVLNHILSSDLKVRLQMYYKRYSKVVGYTYEGTDIIWCNRKYHSYMDPCDVGANLSHEILGHKNGYDHDDKASYDRQFSVPYRIGYLIEKCCQEKK